MDEKRSLVALFLVGLFEESLNWNENPVCLFGLQMIIFTLLSRDVSNPNANMMGICMNQVFYGGWAWLWFCWTFKSGTSILLYPSDYWRRPGKQASVARVYDFLVTWPTQQRLNSWWRCSWGKYHEIFCTANELWRYEALLDEMWNELRAKKGSCKMLFMGVLRGWNV